MTPDDASRAESLRPVVVAAADADWAQRTRQQIAVAKLWRMRDLFHCQPCASEPCGEDCQCPHHDDVGALSEAIKALAGSAEGGQVFRQDIDGIRLEWVRTGVQPPAPAVDAYRARFGDLGGAQP